MPLIFNEDEALKAKLAGIQVPVSRGSASLLNVGVRFGMPQDELAPLTFPIIIIDHTDVGFDPERAHQGWTNLPYAPEGKATWWPNVAGTEYDPKDSPYYLEYPVPVNIDYEITALAREKSHLMALVATLTGYYRLPPRFGSLYIPQDRTARRIEMLASTGIEADRDADNKRIFRAKYAIRVPSEIIPADYPAIFDVTKVNISTLTPVELPVTP